MASAAGQAQDRRGALGEPGPRYVYAVCRKGPSFPRDRRPTLYALFSTREGDGGADAYKAAQEAQEDYPAAVWSVQEHQVDPEHPPGYSARSWPPGEPS